MSLLPVVWTAGILAMVSAGVLCLWKKNGRGLIWWLLPVFCVMGLICVRADEQREKQYRQTVESLEGREVGLKGTLLGIQKRRYGGLALEMTEVTLETEEGEEPFGSVLAYVDREDIPLAIGMRLSLKGKLECFGRPGNPGEFDFGAYYHALGIQARFYVESAGIVSEDYFPYQEGIRRLRCHAAEVLDRVCAPEDSGIFRAMVLGEKTELSDEIRKLYQASGISHLLAVSGLHISMIGLGVFGLSRKAGLGPGGAGLLGGAVTVSYGILAGGTGITASVVRAVIMALLQMGAGYLGRTYDMRTAVAVSGLWLLISSPQLLFQAGFQLSFGAVMALGIAEPVAEAWVKPRTILGRTLMAGAVIQLATCPVVAYHYFEYPVYGILLNLAVIPLMTYVLISGILTVVLGSLSIRLGMAAAGTGHYVLLLYRQLCERTGEIPGSVIVTGRPEGWRIGLYGLVWTVFLTAAARRAGRGGEEQKPCWGRRASFLLLAAATVGLLFFGLPLRGMETTFLDVGQGDGICIRTGQTVVLVDGGSTDRKDLGQSVLNPFLKSRGISKVDYAVVSHGDQDHISGLVELLEEDGGIPVSHVVLPWLGRKSGDEIYENLAALAGDQGAEVLWMKRGDVISAGELKIRCLYAGDAHRAGDRNEHSLLLYVEYGRAGILLTGDMSQEGERDWLSLGETPGVQVLKAAHHGSAYSTGEVFLDWVAPKVAVISCGEGNRYGHPARETLERMEERGVRWIQTKDQGAVTVRVRNGEIKVETFLGSGRRKDGR